MVIDKYKRVRPPDGYSMLFGVGRDYEEVYEEDEYGADSYYYNFYDRCGITWTNLSGLAFSPDDGSDKGGNIPFKPEGIGKVQAIQDFWGDYDFVTLEPNSIQSIPSKKTKERFLNSAWETNSSPIVESVFNKFGFIVGNIENMIRISFPEFSIDTYKDKKQEIAGKVTISYENTSIVVNASQDNLYDFAVNIIDKLKDYQSDYFGRQRQISSNFFAYALGIKENNEFEIEFTTNTKQLSIAIEGRNFNPETKLIDFTIKFTLDFKFYYTQSEKTGEYFEFFKFNDLTENDELVIAKIECRIADLTKKIPIKGLTIFDVIEQVVDFIKTAPNDVIEEEEEEEEGEETEEKPEEEPFIGGDYFYACNSTTQIYFSFFIDWLDDENEIVELKEEFTPPDDALISTINISELNRRTRGANGAVLKNVNLSWYEYELENEVKIPTSIDISVPSGNIVSIAGFDEDSEEVFINFDRISNFTVLRKENDNYKLDTYFFIDLMAFDAGSPPMTFMVSINLNDITKEDITFTQKNYYGFAITGSDILAGVWGEYVNLEDDKPFTAFSASGTKTEYTSSNKIRTLSYSYNEESQTETFSRSGNIDFEQYEVYQGKIKKTVVAQVRDFNCTLVASGYIQTDTYHGPNYTSATGQTNDNPDRSYPGYFWDNEDIKYGKPTAVNAMTYSDDNDDGKIDDLEDGDKDSLVYGTKFTDVGTLKIRYKIPLYVYGQFITDFYQTARRRVFATDWDDADKRTTYWDCLWKAWYGEPENQVFPYEEGGRRFADYFRDTPSCCADLDTYSGDETDFTQTSHQKINPNPYIIKTIPYLPRSYDLRPMEKPFIEARFQLGSGQGYGDVEEPIVHHINTDIPVCLSDEIQSLGVVTSLKYKDAICIWLSKVGLSEAVTLYKSIFNTPFNNTMINSYVSSILYYKNYYANLSTTKPIYKEIADAYTDWLSDAQSMKGQYDSLNQPQYSEDELEEDEAKKEEKEKAKEDIIKLVLDHKRTRYEVIRNNFLSYDIIESLPTGIALYHI